MKYYESFTMNCFAIKPPGIPSITPALSYAPFVSFLYVIFSTATLSLPFSSVRSW